MCFAAQEVRLQSNYFLIASFWRQNDVLWSIHINAYTCKNETKNRKLTCCVSVRSQLRAVVEVHEVLIHTVHRHRALRQVCRRQMYSPWLWESHMRMRVRSVLTDKRGESGRAAVGVFLEAVRDDGALLGRTTSLRVGEPWAELELWAALHSTDQRPHHTCVTPLALLLTNHNRLHKRRLTWPYNTTVTI